MASLKQFQDSSRLKSAATLRKHKLLWNYCENNRASKYGLQCRSLLQSGGATDNVLLTVKTRCTITTMDD
jgi:hypothetical protein